MFLSHPDVCSPIRETLDIFSIAWRRPRMSGLRAALLSRQWHLFDQWTLAPRRPISAAAQQYIDRTLYNWKLQTANDDEMRFKFEGVTYKEEEVASSRLVAKNNNGLTFLTDIWLEMYKDATFFALVRHPVPLYESHKRRNIISSPAAFADFYNKMINRMHADVQALLCYHLVRFEDLLSQPIASMQKLYAQANLDWNRIEKVRFKAKPHMQADGTHDTGYLPGRHYWFEPDDVGCILDPGVNEYQIDRLQSVERDAILRLTESSRNYLGYN